MQQVLVKGKVNQLAGTQEISGGSDLETRVSILPSSTRDLKLGERAREGLPNTSLASQILGIVPTTGTGSQ